jgi:hypothetical protein
MLKGYRELAAASSALVRGFNPPLRFEPLWAALPAVCSTAQGLNTPKRFEKCLMPYISVHAAIRYDTVSVPISSRSTPMSGSMAYSIMAVAPSALSVSTIFSASSLGTPSFIILGALSTNFLLSTNESPSMLLISLITLGFDPASNFSSLRLKSVFSAAAGAASSSSAAGAAAAGPAPPAATKPPMGMSGMFRRVCGELVSQLSSGRIASLRRRVLCSGGRMEHFLSSGHVGHVPGRASQLVCPHVLQEDVVRKSCSRRNRSPRKSPVCPANAKSPFIGYTLADRTAPAAHPPQSAPILHKLLSYLECRDEVCCLEQRQLADLVDNGRNLGVGGHRRGVRLPSPLYPLLCSSDGRAGSHRRAGGANAAPEGARYRGGHAVLWVRAVDVIDGRRSSCRTCLR